MKLAVGPQASVPTLLGLRGHNLGTMAPRLPHKAVVSARSEEAEKAPREPQLPIPLCMSIVLTHNVTLREQLRKVILLSGPLFPDVQDEGSGWLLTSRKVFPVDNV